MRRIASVLALVLIGIGALAGCGGGTSTAAGLDGFVTVPGEPMGPAHEVLTQTDGTAWRFDATPPGKLTLLYFGYTSCPDVCPTTMADLAVAMRALPPEVRDRFEVQFVSTDPARDSADQIESWLSAFDPTFRGARAPIETVIEAARAYGIGINLPKKVDGDYQVTHGAQLLVLTPGGAAVGYFRELAGRSAYQEGLPALVEKYLAS